MHMNLLAAYVVSPALTHRVSPLNAILPSRVYVDGVTQKINAVLGPSWVMIFDSVETVEG